MRSLRAVALIVLPFAAAYFVSYFFRTINAVISETLARAQKLDASQLGLLTSVYFLTFASMQIPVGILLDRYGPKRVQSVLLLFSAAGAALFGFAHNFEILLTGRALIGFGVAASLTAGLKAITIWFPKDRLALINGCFITIGTLGVVFATLPAEWLLHFVGWKTLFELLAVVCTVCAGAIFSIVPEPPSVGRVSKTNSIQIGRILTDARFWRLAPISMMCISTAWALQGLWAAPWFADVDRLSRSSIVGHLFAMSIALSMAAMLLGIIVNQMRRQGVQAQVILGCVAGLLIAAQIALIGNFPVPALIIWCVIASAGAATVISYSAIAELFPKEMSGQANAVLNTLHIGGAFVIQTSIGLVISHWTMNGGHYPVIAYKTAFCANLIIQAIALGWFFVPFGRRTEPVALEYP